MFKKYWFGLGDNVEIIQVKNEQNSENTLCFRVCRLTLSSGCLYIYEIVNFKCLRGRSAY